jgi:hypothetical protein
MLDKDRTAIIDDDDDDAVINDNVRPAHICCENCLFRNTYMLKETKSGHKKYLCRLNPPQIILIDKNLVPVLGIVRSFDYCGSFISRETKETFETIMGVK